MSAFETVARKSYNDTNELQKLIFRSGISSITDADIGSLKSPHELFDKHLDHMLLKFEMVRNIHNLELFDKNV